MNLTANKLSFINQIDQFSPTTNGPQRTLAFYAAAITFGDEDVLTKVVDKAVKLGLTLPQLYETVLMSYLFLGFPRMLIAATHLSRLFPQMKNEANLKRQIPNDISEWVERGEGLCRKIYREKFEPLRYKIASFSPEIFEWMITEGYGKVLSREKLDISSREICIVSFLTMENRYHQLYAHTRGALNVGVEFGELDEVVDQLESSAGDGYQSAKKILKELRNKYEAD